MVAELKYGSGMPFNRIENLEGRLGIPLPAATQWGMVAEAADLLQPVQEELIREAAQGELFHNDDTSVRILQLERPAGDERTGVPITRPTPPTGCGSGVGAENSPHVHSFVVSRSLQETNKRRKDCRKARMSGQLGLS